MRDQKQSGDTERKFRTQLAQRPWKIRLKAIATGEKLLDREEIEKLAALSELSEPLLRIVAWYEDIILKETLNAAAHREEPTYLFFDEVQNISNWAVQLKHLVDHATMQVVITDSSPLRIEQQGRESLAGRVTTIEAGALSLKRVSPMHRLAS